MKSTCKVQTIQAIGDTQVQVVFRDLKTNMQIAWPMETEDALRFPIHSIVEISVSASPAAA